MNKKSTTPEGDAIYNVEGTASHYNTNRIEAMVILERTYGTYAAMLFCEMTAMKYRLRIGEKDVTSQELKKIKWYEKKAKMYFDRLGTSTEIIISNTEPVRS